MIFPKDEPEYESKKDIPTEFPKISQFDIELLDVEINLMPFFTLNEHSLFRNELLCPKFDS